MRDFIFALAAIIAWFLSGTDLILIVGVWMRPDLTRF
jgi:hypothetical protein